MKAKVASCYLLSTIFSLFALPQSLHAQISSDGSLSTTVSTDDAVNFLIENGDRSGSNLFHSFSEFSIPNLGSAYFDNAVDVTNIFSRVTGGNISDIQGLIRANGTANLFLINPAGIVFGENASLDVGGSFLATTAQSVVFGDGIEFSALEPQEAPLLTINITPGLQMGANPGSIQVQGNGHGLSNGGFPFAVTGTRGEPQISVNPGNTIALIGGEITLNGGLVVAENGNIELGAISTENNNTLVSFNTTDTGWTFNYDNIDNFAPIQMLQRSLLDTTGTNPGNINLTSSTIEVLDASFTLIENQGESNAGNITVNASEQFTLSGFITTEEGRVFSTLANITSANGNAGDVTIDAPQIYVRDRSEIRSTTVSNGNSGEITLRASKFIQLDNSILDSEGVTQGNSVIFATTFGSGNAGVINIFTPQLNLFGGSQIGNTTFDAGNSNDININTQRLLLQERASITSSASFASGNGGNITITATEFIDMVGSPRESTENVIIGASTIRDTGNAGKITINTPRLSLQQGAIIQSSTLGYGNGGTVTINASESVELSGSRLHTTFGIRLSTIRSAGTLRPEAVRNAVGLPDEVTGRSGNVTINTPRLAINDGAEVAVSHDSVGDGGNLEVNADSIFLNNQGQIAANTASGNGGNIDLTINNGLLLRNGSKIITEAGGTGNGGNIDINSDLVTLLENSQINANAFEGNGGNITITTQGLFVSPNSSITASSQFGVDGTITFNTPDEENKLAIAELPANFTDASEQIVGNCSWTNENTFYVTGRSGIAKTPQEHIEIYQMWSDIRDLSEFESATVIRESSPRQDNTIVEANAMIINEDGKVELVAVVPSNNQNLGRVASSCSREVGS